ncbi:cytochrome d ubiquinol oxidase subunit II [Jatrophihabitans sp.]|uniref:cytochrome d ubiquinol oxidase subunit II n=1 Tax=Jatrophihabitans sp. TaxID=1932789 RepID=UPI0030C660FD|nr:cytochrome d oxidase cyd, subunit [Jatrophihabitans sp.]
MLQGFWFGTIAVLWAGFLMLEGFDFGVGMLLPFVTRTDTDRRIALRSIGPVWDGNEVWLLVAGGATFAAFPEWYASVFSGFYIAFALLLVGLILRGIGIEYRGKAETANGRHWCDRAIVVGSFLPALLLGVAFADFLRGVKMDAGHNMAGGFFDLVTPFGLLGGVVTLTLFLFHGAVFLALRTEGAVAFRAKVAAKRVAPVTAVAAVAFVLWTAGTRGGWLSFLLGAVLVVAFVASLAALWLDRIGLAFSASALVCLLVPVWVFSALWPDVLPARNSAALSLTVHNASSSHYTLVVMTVVALLFTPIVIAYQAWTYWVFRARVGAASVGHGGYEETVVGRLRHAASVGTDGESPAEPR